MEVVWFQKAEKVRLNQELYRKDICVVSSLYLWKQRSKVFHCVGEKKKKNKQQNPHFLSPLARPRKTRFVQWYKRKTGPAQDRSQAHIMGMNLISILPYQWSLLCISYIQNLMETDWLLWLSSAPPSHDPKK